MHRGLRCMRTYVIAQLTRSISRLCPAPPRSLLCRRPVWQPSTALHTSSWISKVRCTPKNSASAPSPSQSISGAEERYEEIEIQLPERCGGCGVRLQQDDAEAPGFFQVPKRIVDLLSNNSDLEQEDGESLETDGDSARGERSARDGGAGFTGDGEEWQQFDAVVEGWLDIASDGRDGRGSRVREPKSFAEAEEEEDPTDALVSEVLCARCYSLRHYGKIKSIAAEEALPCFDFERIVGRRIALQKFRREVVVAVVDLADFDGSLPRAAVRSLLPPESRNGAVSGRLPPGFRLVIAANKSDLLPRAATTARLTAWVRKRAAQGGLPRPSAVHIVSSERGSGVKALLADLQDAVGTRGDVWVVGAQNAGKSSLINAMRGAIGLPTSRAVTAAPVPGTTLGLVQVPVLLPRGCKMLDTPGVPHAHQLSSVLTAEEMRLVLPRRPLSPRTFRLGPGQTVSIGGVSRVDVLECPGATMYLTIWVSDQIVCHMGKTANAGELLEKHRGSALTPPIGGNPEALRAQDLPAFAPTEVDICGDSWRNSSMDVAVAGLGWVGVGVDGAAKLLVWAPSGVAVTTRESLVPDFAQELERPGFGAVVAPKGSGSRGATRSAGVVPSKGKKKKK